MLIFLAFVFLLTPFPTHQASVGERKNSTKTAPHTITTLNIKQKQPALSSASKISNVSQNLVSSTMPPETPSVKKPSKNKPPSSSPIKVVIAEGCIQKEHQKDTINSSKAQETELSLKPGSPLVMTHHINLVPGSCTGGCETEMATLKDRVEILEKEMSALKKKCIVCSGVQCPNNCNKNGECVNGKCVCHSGFTGTACSKENVKKPSQNNDMKVLKGVVSMTQKMKNANATEELKGGDKKRNLNATTSTKTEKNSTKQSVILLKEGSSEMKTEKHSDEKDKKLNKGNVTPLNKVSLGKIKVEKHLNVNNATEKDRKSQSNATPLEEKTSGEGNVTTSSEKWKKVATGDETKNVKFTQGNKSKTGLQHGNITASTEKDNKLHQGNATHTKDGSSRKTKKDSHLNGTMSLEKDKALSQNNGEKKLGKKVDKVNEKKSNEKGKKFLQGDEMTVIKILSVAEEGVNVSVTTTSEKDKSLQHSLKEDASSKSKVNSDLKNITISKTHVERTTKPTDVGPVAVHNITATGFVITWEASQGVFRNFTVTKKEVWSGRSSEDDAEEAEKSPNGDLKADKFISSNKTSSNVYTGKAERKSAEKFSQILAGSARSYHFKNLRPQRKYLVSLFGSGPHVRSKVHSLYVSTGPEPPTELLFSNITETSLILSWTKPKSTVTGFKVTYTNSANGVTGSMSVDSQLSHVLISKLSVGSRYEISIRSVMRAIKSEATTASVVTVPDSPTDLQAMNITDSKALLVWKPAEAKVDHYILTYGSTRSPNVTVTVMLSGNSVQHQLRGLHRSTLYAVKILSQINSLQSSSVSTTFTTKSGVKLQVVTPNEVTWNSAVISWKSTHIAFRSYRLTYQFGEEVKEVILNPTVSQYKLTDLVASSHYTVKVDGESEGQYISVVSIAFTTAQLPYQYPVECSQVQVNGMKESGEAEIYPQGKERDAVRVYCDMETDGGGWTVFQRRLDGSTDFFREWRDYSEGFGELSAEFWLGNDILHALTNTEPMSLRVDLRLGNDTAYAHYSNFSVGSEVNHYTIEVSGYSGTAGDSMRYHNGCPFSTNDKDPSSNVVQCAKKYMGGWWYKNCYKANLNGVYATFSKDQGVVWIDWKGKDISLPFTEMKLRPVSLSHMTPNTQG
ncbi:tenascin [Tachysurus ichikawai]